MADDETTAAAEDVAADDLSTDDVTTDEPVRKDDDWQAKARKHERDLKKARKDAEDARAKLAAREAADMTEHEKAIADAKEAGKAEALTQAQQDRRADRLEVAVTRLAAQTFADTEDALTNIERAISRGDLDPEDIYDSEGKVQTDALRTALEDLLARKPHLAVKAPGPGGNDAGKGSGSSLTVEQVKAMSPDEINRRWDEIQPVLARQQ